MEKYKQISIKMTSNTTPEPFLIDNIVNSSSNNSNTSYVYKMFDNNTDTGYTLYSNSSVAFNITLVKM